MKKLIEQYKDSVISFLLAGILIGLVVSLLVGLGMKVSPLVQTQNYKEFTDRSVLQTVAAIPKPKILIKEEMHWEAGAEIVLSQAFTATDSIGQELIVQVVQLEDSEEQDITAWYNPLTGIVVFPEPGCYYATLLTMDSQRKVTVEKRPLIIDR